MEKELDFESLGITFPVEIKSYSTDIQREIFDYLSEMNENERKGYEIALNHLESSFSIYRSNGFITWKKNRSINK
jgi:hypothetical protein